MFNGYSPLAVLLFVAALAMILGAVIVLVFSACISTYYKEKDARWSKWFKALAKAFESAGKSTILKKLDEIAEMQKKKEEDSR